MDPYGSVWAHIKTGRSPMAHDHFQTPLDPEKGHTNPKLTNKLDFFSRGGHHTVAARALATYLIPGCVGRGVRLGSENSSGAGGVWKSGNLWRKGSSRSKILKSLTQGFQQVQNPEIFVARVPEESNYNASIVNILRIYRESIVNLSGTCPRCQQLKN